MRNHLVIRSADLVVAVSGGSGTLSEMSIACQEGKPIAALRGSDGWGVYAGRMNQGFYPLETPVLHRVHEGAPDKYHRLHLRYGMSTAKSDLVRRLEEWKTLLGCPWRRRPTGELNR